MPAAAPDAQAGVPLWVRLPNWVGDVCMALPALRALAACGAAPRPVGRGWAADLLAGHGWTVTALPRGLRAGAAALRAAGGPARGLLLTNSLSSAATFRLAGVSALGHRADGRSWLLGRGIAKPPSGHEVEAFWRLGAETAAWLGLRGWPAVPPASLGLVLAERHRAAADEALAAAGLAGARVAVVAPLAAGSAGGVPKTWPGFAELDDALRARGLATVVCPGPGEDAAARAAVPGATVLPGLGLGAYAAVCGRAAITVANDSGPMHLAAAVDAPVLGVFGPSDPARTRPWGPRAAWIGGGDWPSPDAVLEAALRVMDASPA
ncbi:MAG: ADP-heptose--LPS heptosyltransferase 2 [Pseudomonadota bacterium]|jgi:heptosyltransferase-2